MQIFIKIFTVFLITTSTQMLCAEERLIFGADIKKIAQSYLAENGIYNEILVSEKRAYFPCNEKISITQKHPSSWHTLKAHAASRLDGLFPLERKTEHWKVSNWDIIIFQILCR